MLSTIRAYAHFWAIDMFFGPICNGLDEFRHMWNWNWRKRHSLLAINKRWYGG